MAAAGCCTFRGCGFGIRLPIDCKCAISVNEVTEDGRTDRDKEMQPLRLQLRA